MASCTATDKVKETSVGMGQVIAGQAPHLLRSVLGSCIGVAVYYPRCQTGVLAHVVLPAASGRAGSPGKFADTAIPHILDLLKEMGVPCHGLTAKLAGGASMFGGDSSPLQVGEANAKAVSSALKRVNVSIAGKDVGGTSGRRVTFDCSTGEMAVEVVGKPVRIL